MKIKLWLLAAVLIAPAWGLPQGQPPTSAGERVIRFISDLDSPPFAYLEGLKKTGFEIDLGEAIGKELGAKVEWIRQKFDIPTISSTLATKGAEAALCSISITPERKQYLAFTRPYFRTSLALAVRKEIRWRGLNFERGLEDQIIGVMRRTTGEEWARRNLKATRKTYDSPQRLARALKDDEVFAILIDEDILNDLLASRSYKFKIVERALDHEDYGIAVSKDDQALLNELNVTLDKLDAKGVYDRIYDNWFDRPRDLP